MHILQIFFPYYNLSFAFQHFLERFGFQFKLSMGIMGFFFLSFIPVMVEIKLQLQCTRDVWFQFSFTQSHSFRVPFEDSFWRICKRRLPIHKANTFTNELVNSHCRQIWEALWIPAVSHFGSGTQLFKHLHGLHLLCSSTGSALRPSMVFFLSTIYCSPLTETSFLTHLSDFRPTLSCFLLCSYVL